MWNKFLVRLNFYSMIFWGLLSVVYINIFKKPNYAMLFNFKKRLLNGGPLFIKLAQWITSRCDILNKEWEPIINTVFGDLFNNCYLPEEQYLRETFLKEYGIDLSDVIELCEHDNMGGSVGQIYTGFYKDNPDEKIVIKCVHESMRSEDTIFNIKLFFKHKWIIDKLLGGIPWNADNIIDWMKKQTDMKHEYDNLDYFYNFYKESSSIIIPKPISCSNNILIMKYEEGISVTSDKLSIYQTMKALNILMVFIRNNMFEAARIHCDLHLGNWAIRKDNNNNIKIVIYDFGFCEIFSEFNELCNCSANKYIKEIVFNLEQDKYKEVFDNLINFYVGNPEKKDWALNLFYEIGRNSANWIADNGYRDIDFGLKETLKCAVNNKIEMDIRIINAILGVIQTRGIVKKYLIHVKASDYLINNGYYQEWLSCIQTCSDDKCFQNIKKFHEENIKKIMVYPTAKLLNNEDSIIKNIKNNIKQSGEIEI